MALQGEEMKASIPFSQVALGYMMNQAQADRAAALVSLTSMLEHPAGIGDHSTSDLHKGLDEALSKLCDADGRIATLQHYFPPNESTENKKPETGPGFGSQEDYKFG
jgi:hypothetical protein